jgi:alkylation response protein AidB-like acyl-CoA dehydrogenase
VLEATRALLPQVKSYSDQIESERKLPQALVDELANAGVYKMLAPKSFGGGEVDPETFCLVLEELSQADGSTGWTSLLPAMSSAAAAFLSEDVAWEIFGQEPNACVACSVAPAPNPSQRPPDRAIAVDGGYCVTGRWSFASSCMQATWIGGQCSVYDGEATRIDCNGQPESRIFYFPVSQCQIIDTWNTTGLRGTGSNDFAVTDRFVAHPYTLPLTNELKTRHPGPLYMFTAGPISSTGRIAPWTATGSIGVAAVCLGIARAALDALIELAGVKTPRGASGRLVSNPVFQDQIGKAEATLGTARAYMYETTRQLWQRVLATGCCHTNHHTLLRLAGTHAAMLAAQVVDMIWTAAGASAIFVDSPIERRFRDIHTATQNIAVRPECYIDAGRTFLGLE